MLCSSLYAGTIAMRRMPSADTRLLSKADQLEQLPRTVSVGVLVEDALACTAAHLLGLRRVGEQIAVGLDRLLASSTMSSSEPGSNHRSMPLYGFATIAAPADASSNGRQEDDA